MLPDDARQGTEGVVSFPRVWKSGGYIRFQDHDGASDRVSRGILVAHGTTEIVLRQDIVCAGAARTLPFTGCFFHSFAASGSPKTVAASSNETLCLTRLAAALVPLELYVRCCGSQISLLAKFRRKSAAEGCARGAGCIQSRGVGWIRALKEI